MIKILIRPILEWSEGEDVLYFSEEAEMYELRGNVLKMLFDQI